MTGNKSHAISLSSFELVRGNVEAFRVGNATCNDGTTEEKVFVRTVAIVQWLLIYKKNGIMFLDKKFIH